MKNAVTSTQDQILLFKLMGQLRNTVTLISLPKSWSAWSLTSHIRSNIPPQQVSDGPRRCRLRSHTCSPRPAAGLKVAFIHSHLLCSVCSPPGGFLCRSLIFSSGPRGVWDTGRSPCPIPLWPVMSLGGGAGLMRWWPFALYLLLSQVYLWVPNNPSEPPPLPLPSPFQLDPHLLSAPLLL